MKSSNRFWQYDEALDENLRNKVSGLTLMENTAAIARWIRLSGTAEELFAFKYVKERLEEYGFSADLVFHDAYISLPRRAELRLADGTMVDCIAHAFTQSTPSAGLTAELLYVAAPGKVNREEVSGKIVLVDGLASPMSTLEYEALGAVGQIYIHDDYLHETAVSPQWGSPTDITIETYPVTAGISIRRSDGDKLKQLLPSGPLLVTMHTEVDTGWVEIPLLTAELAGDSDDFVLFSSHIDSWHYGAMDNGSANATVMEVARLLGQHSEGLRRTLRVAFWSGHSHGRFCGSAWYADENWQELHDKCIAHVYCDSTGGMNAVIVTEPPIMPETKSLAAEALKSITDEKFVGKRIGRFADQSFYGLGIPALFGTFSEQDASQSQGNISFKTGGVRAGGLGWWWHAPEDTIDKVDKDNLIRDTRAYVSAVVQLLTCDIIPVDYRAATIEMQETLSELAGPAEPAGLNLHITYKLLAALRNKLDGFYENLEMNNGPSRPVNVTLHRLGKHLIPMRFHETSNFDHDWGGPLQPIPALQSIRALRQLEQDSDEAHLLRTRLKRSVNRINSELHSAIQLFDQ